jgi:hypothetical protein
MREPARSWQLLIGPFEVWAKPGTIGRVDEHAFLAWVGLGAAALLAVYLVSDSEVLQLVTLFVVLAPWRWMQRQAATTRPLPPYPDPPPKLPSAWLRWGVWLLGGLALGAALGGLSYLGGGLGFWLFIGGLAPLAFAANRYGVVRRPRALRWRGGWLSRSRSESATSK